MYVFHRAIYHGTSLAAFSGGYAVGTYLAPNLLPSACAMWFEISAQMILSLV